MGNTVPRGVDAAAVGRAVLDGRGTGRGRAKVVTGTARGGGDPQRPPGHPCGRLLIDLKPTARIRGRLAPPRRNVDRVPAEIDAVEAAPEVTPPSAPLPALAEHSAAVQVIDDESESPLIVMNDWPAPWSARGRRADRPPVVHQTAVGTQTRVSEVIVDPPPAAGAGGTP